MVLEEHHRVPRWHFQRPRAEIGSAWWPFGLPSLSSSSQLGSTKAPRPWGQEFCKASYNPASCDALEDWLPTYASPKALTCCPWSLPLPQDHCRGRQNHFTSRHWSVFQAASIFKGLATSTCTRARYTFQDGLFPSASKD
jgi:hypothetical protein